MLVYFKGVAIGSFVGVADHAHGAERLVRALQAFGEMLFPQTPQILHFGRIFSDVPQRRFPQIAADIILPARAGVHISVGNHAD